MYRALKKLISTESCGLGNGRGALASDLRIANAAVWFRYAEGQTETRELVPPLKFWSLCRFGNMDCNYKRGGFALGEEPLPQVRLGENCRAMVYGWKLLPGVALVNVTLETLSEEVVIGWMVISLMNP